MAALAVAGCAVTTEPGSAGVPVLGVWRYGAQQASPATAELTGTLAFTTQAAASLAGAVDLVEVDARGTPRRLTGALAGRTIDSTTVDFDVALSTTTRRHVGRVIGDSIAGSWIEQPISGGAPVASGTFGARRQR